MRITGESITTHNRYDKLKNDDPGDTSDEDATETAKLSAKAVKLYIPPIVIKEKLSNYALIMKEINSITTTKNTNFVFNKHGLSIKANNKTDYAIIKTKLDVSNTQYYTHPLKEERNKQLVIKGLPII